MERRTQTSNFFERYGIYSIGALFLIGAAYGFYQSRNDPWAIVVVGLFATLGILTTAVAIVSAKFHSYRVEKSCSVCHMRETAIMIKRNRKSLDKALANQTRKNHHPHVLQWKIEELPGGPLPEDWHQIEY